MKKVIYGAAALVFAAMMVSCGGKSSTLITKGEQIETRYAVVCHRHRHRPRHNVSDARDEVRHEGYGRGRRGRLVRKGRERRQEARRGSRRVAKLLLDGATQAHADAYGRNSGRQHQGRAGSRPLRRRQGAQGGIIRLRLRHGHQPPQCPSAVADILVHQGYRGC